jgi:hypothetical protein
MSNDDLDDGGRRFPRSTREAFPEERGQWFEPPDDDRLMPLWLGIALCLFAMLAVVLLM